MNDEQRAAALRLADTPTWERGQAWIIDTETLLRALAAEPVTDGMAKVRRITDACLSYRHDFGLMNQEDRQRLMYTAQEWARAFGIDPEPELKAEVSMHGKQAEPVALREVIDIDREDMATLTRAAAESDWIPAEYTRNEWVTDCAAFLRHRAEPVTEPVAGYYNPELGLFMPPDAKGLPEQYWKPVYFSPPQDTALREANAALHSANLDCVAHVELMRDRNAALREAAQGVLAAWDSEVPVYALYDAVARLRAVLEAK